MCTLLNSLEKLMKPKLLKAKLSLKDLQRYVQMRLDEHELFDDHDVPMLMTSSTAYVTTTIYSTHEFWRKLLTSILVKGHWRSSWISINERNEFIKKATVSFLKEMKDELSRRISAHLPQVVFKLTGYWLKATVARLQKFVEHIFEEEASNFTHIRVKTGCVCISWSIRICLLSQLWSLWPNRNFSWYNLLES